MPKRVLDPGRPTVNDLAPLIRAVYESPNGGAGCCLHIVTDDDNHAQSHYEFVYSWAMEANAREPGQHDNCVKAAEMMTRMTTTQVRKATNIVYRYV